MYRFFALATLTALSLMLLISCSDSMDTAGPIQPADKRGGGPNIDNPPTEEELYLLAVKNSFDDVEFSTTAIEIPIEGGYFEFCPPGYPADLFVSLTVEPIHRTLSDTYLAEIQIPLPPRGSEYLEVFGNNMLYRTRGLPTESEAIIGITIPIAPWINPEGISKNMTSFTLEKVVETGMFVPSNVIPVPLDEWPVPDGVTATLEINDYIDKGELDEYADSVLDDRPVNDPL
jgi:hypothetical protein